MEIINGVLQDGNIVAGGGLLASNNLSDVDSAATSFANIKQAATESTTGVVELATDAETVTGTDTGRATTPANITAKMAAPGTIGGTTPGEGNFTNLNITGVLTSAGEVHSAGLSWTDGTNAADRDWRGLCYGDGLFVSTAATGTGDRVQTSPDGINWTQGTSAEDNSWLNVCYGNGLFVAVAINGTNRVMTSPDGFTWTARAAAAANEWRGVCYGEGLFVAVGSAGTGDNVMTSPDGITWTSRTSAEDNTWRNVCYGNGTFVAVSSDGTNRVMTSPDGITWTARAASAANSWFDVCYGNGLFVAIAYSGTGTRVMTSPDGTTWTTRTSAADNTWYKICYGDGLFVAIAASGSLDRVMTSADGITWTSRTTTDETFYGLCYGDGLFVGMTTDTVCTRSGKKNIINNFNKPHVRIGNESLYGNLAATGSLTSTTANANALVLGGAAAEGGDIAVYRDASGNKQLSLDADAASNAKAVDIYGGTVIQNYLTVGTTSLNTSYAFYVNGNISSSSSIFSSASIRSMTGFQAPSGYGLSSREDNQATLISGNISVTGTDATDHAVKLQIDSNDIIVAKATGDGAGGITNPKAIAYKPLHITAPADADGLILGGTATEGCDVSIYRDGSGNKQVAIDADAASNAKALDVYGGVVAQNYLTVADTSLNTTYPLYINGNASVSTLNLAGGQIVFPASQSASAGANTLDDYEEGSWTPDLQFGDAKVGITYSIQVGYYTKIGSTVYFTVQITLSSKGSSTGDAKIYGLPFTSGQIGGCALWYLGVTYTGMIESIILASGTGINLYQIEEDSTLNLLDDTNFSNTSRVWGTGFYIV